MSRRLIALNLLLLALCGAAGWRLWRHAQDVEYLQNRFLSQKVPPSDPPVIATPQAPSPASAATYLDVAAKLLFNRDRNPVVVIEDKAPPKVMPQLPRFHGLFQLNGPPRIVLSERDGAPQKSYALGDTIGEFKLLNATQAGLVFEWDGKKVGALYSELRPQADSAAAQPAPVSARGGSASPAASTPVSTVSSVSPAELRKPGESISATMRYCTPGDTLPEGAVVDGFRKVNRKTPFGTQCYWEKIQ